MFQDYNDDIRQEQLREMQIMNGGGSGGGGVGSGSGVIKNLHDKNLEHSQLTISSGGSSSSNSSSNNNKVANSMANTMNLANPINLSAVSLRCAVRDRQQPISSVVTFDSSNV